MSNRCRPITIAPMAAHIGRTYSAETWDTDTLSFTPISASPFAYQSKRGPT